MSILAIEFDQADFATVAACETWLENHPEYFMVTENKGFRLIVRPKSTLMSDEARRTFSWHGNLHRYRDMTTARPESGIVVVIKTSDRMWTPADWPTQSAKTRRKKEVARQRQVISQLKKERNAEITAIKKLQRSLASGKPTKRKADLVVPLPTDDTYGPIRKIKKRVRRVPTTSQAGAESEEADTEKLESIRNVLLNGEATLPSLDDSDSLELPPLIERST